MLSLLLLLGAAQASPVDSLDAELQLGFGGGGLGLWSRANHSWAENPWMTLQSGVALGVYSSAADWSRGSVSFEGRSSDLHLQVHSGVVLNAGERDLFYAELGLYGGGYVYRSRGSWRSEALDLTEPTESTALLPDWGFRLALGVAPKPGWGVQLTLTDSLRRLGGEQGVLGGLVTMDADAKLCVGLGVNVRFK